MYSGPCLPCTFTEVTRTSTRCPWCAITSACSTGPGPDSAAIPTITPPTINHPFGAAVISSERVAISVKVPSTSPSPLQSGLAASNDSPTITGGPNAPSW